jgi:nucleoside-diphosphate-sugar epimerase
VRILVTGGSGYLGSAAVPALRARGHEVVTIGRHPGVDAACDLTDGDAVHKAVRAVGNCDAVVHLAARAHDFRGLTLDDLLLANTTTTRNLAAALRAEGRTAAVRFVHASSVAVYDLLNARRPLTAEQAPYAASKLQAEQLLHAEPFHSLHLLRFAPIYDPAHLQDVKKRVFFPGTRVKLRLYPPPMHSLCSLDRAVQSLVDAVEKTPSHGSFVVNATDPQPISQRELVGWFPGLAVPVPTAVLRAFARGLSLCGQPGRAASRLTSKFTTDTTYPQVPAVHATSEAQGDVDRNRSTSAW